MLAKWQFLYTHQTAPEKALEPHIAALGLPYRFQHPVGKFYPDFAIFTKGLDKPGILVEVDGDEHYTPAGLRKDAERTLTLEGKGWRVVRCRNAEALADPKGTVARLMKAAKEVK